MARAPRPRSRLRRVLRGLAWCGLAVVVLTGVAVALLHTGWGKHYVRGKLEARLAARFHGQVTLASLDYGFLFSSVDLGGLVVRDAAGRQAIAVERVQVALDRGSLLGGSPVIDQLTVTGLAVAVTQDPAGRSNLGTLLVPSPGRSTLEGLTIRALTVTGSATITRADGTTATVSDLATTGTVSARPLTQAVAVTLARTTGMLTLVRPGQAPRVMPLAIEGTTLTRAGTVFDVSVRGIAAGALSMDALTAHLALGADGQLAGDQAVAITALRLDHAKLTALLDRSLIAHDVTVDATLAGPPAAMAVHGVVSSQGAKLALDGTIDASDRLRPRYDLVLAGAGSSADILVAPLPRLPAIGTAIRIGVRGAGTTLPTLDATVTLDVGKTTVGAVALDSITAAVTAKHGAFTLERFAARGLGLALDATGSLAADSTLTGRMTVAGNPQDVIAVLEQSGIVVPKQLPRLPRIELAITARGTLAGDLVVTLEPMQLALAGGAVALGGTATLRDRKVARASTILTLRSLNLAQLGHMAGRTLPVHGMLDGTIGLTHTAAGRVVDYDLTVTTALGKIFVIGRTDGTPARIRAKLQEHGIELGSFDASLPIDARGFDPRGAWRIQGALPGRSLAALVAMLPPALAAKLPPALGGEVAMRVDLGGTPAAPRGTIDASVRGPRSLEFHATVAPGPTGIVVTTSGSVDAGGIRVPVTGTVTVPRLFAGRRLDRGALRRATIDQTLELTARPIAELGLLPTRLVALGGTVAGKLRVTGTPAAVALDGAVTWRDYATADGKTGETTLAVAGSPQQLHATLTHGVLTLTADVTRSADQVAIHATAHAPETALLPLLPAALGARIPAAAEPGTLSVDLSADLGLVRTDRGFRLDAARVAGGLRVEDGAFALPGSARRWHGIELELAGDPRGVRLVTLDIRESDRQLTDRRVHAAGMLTLDGIRPTHLELALETHDWLLLGLPSPLLTDAPSAALDLRARLTADLTLPVPAVDITVDDVALKAPDRRDRAHQPERASVSGDVIFIDAGTVIGKLPVPVATPPPQGLPALDVKVHLPGPAHIVRAPLDIMVEGELAIAVRPDGIHPTGSINLVGGKLNLFAQDHALVRGTITVDAAHPKGWLDLQFERQLPDFAARDIADPAIGARLALTGEPSHPRVALSGSTGGALPEVFAMYNAGRSLYAPRPGLPPSATVQVPRGDQANVLVFVSLALPQLLFLDRISAWSDANEPRGAYGRIRNLEADRYLRDGRARVRTVGRPTTPGRSTGELQLDHLLLHSARAALGIGLRAGDRLGGGLGLIFEWSSTPSK